MAINLPRFQYQSPLVDSNNLPTTAFHIWWDTFAKQLETVLTDQANQLAAITALQAEQASQLASITTLQSDMADRITEISQLQSDMLDRITEIEAVQRNDSISSSWTSPGQILTASDAGTNTTITVADHTRKYGDSTSVFVTGSAITGLAYSTTYQIYYDDAARTGGAVTFNATTNPNNALHNAVVGRHYCGEITTPAAGGGSTSGGVSPPSSGGQIDFNSTP